MDRPVTVGLLLRYTFADHYVCHVRAHELAGGEMPAIIDYLRTKHGDVVSIDNPDNVGNTPPLLAGIDDRRVEKAVAYLVELLCKSAGTSYRGIQSGFGVTPSLVLFQNSKGSSCALPLTDLTVEKIRARIEESDMLFKTAASAGKQ